MRGPTAAPVTGVLEVLLQAAHSKLRQAAEGGRGVQLSAAECWALRRAHVEISGAKILKPKW